jgi:hypothetical protein
MPLNCLSWAVTRSYLSPGHGTDHLGSSGVQLQIEYSIREHREWMARDKGATRPISIQFKQTQ